MPVYTRTACLLTTSTRCQIQSGPNVTAKINLYFESTKLFSYLLYVQETNKKHSLLLYIMYTLHRYEIDTILLLYII
ncbi:hypothetical protein EVA_08922 [gut metagenome]|uniref:Uncharacterized protein n=1 Tax=gut metagenome TaxID=749906 RepID=J9CRY6_9ZZZZ